MPLKKSIPSSKYITVTFLLLALLASISVIAIEVKNHRSTTAAQAAETRRVANKPAASSGIIIPNLVVGRNPFTRPSDLQAPVNDTEPKAVLRQRSVNGGAHKPWRIPCAIPPVLPATIYSDGITVRKIEPPSENSFTPETSKLPEAVLKAIIKGPGGRVGVIEIGGLPAQMASEGDILNGGFRVKRLGDDHAVLTKGEDEIIAKRPRI